jgi:hypothetical protein
VPRRRPTLPPARPVLWPLRAPESAGVWIDDGTVLTVRVDHAPLAGVTARMLAWWYAHVPGTMAYAGRIVPRYLVWHPLDHVSYEVRGAASVVTQGARLRIRSVLQRDPVHALDLRVVVEELGPRRAVIARRLLGTSLVRLENDFADGPAGATYRTTLTVGDTSALARCALNHVARRRAFPATRVPAWIRHHVEEIGNLQHFLPGLYAAR